MNTSNVSGLLTLLLSPGTICDTDFNPQDYNKGSILNPQALQEKDLQKWENSDFANGKCEVMEGGLLWLCQV